MGTSTNILSASGDSVLNLDNNTAVLSNSNGIELDVISGANIGQILIEANDVNVGLYTGGGAEQFNGLLYINNKTLDASSPNTIGRAGFISTRGSTIKQSRVASAILGGEAHTIDANNTVILGGNTITATLDNAAYVPTLVVQSGKEIISGNTGSVIKLDDSGVANNYSVNTDDGVDVSKYSQTPSSFFMDINGGQTYFLINSGLFSLANVNSFFNLDDTTGASLQTLNGQTILLRNVLSFSSSDITLGFNDIQLNAARNIDLTPIVGTINLNNDTVLLTDKKIKSSSNDAFLMFDGTASGGYSSFLSSTNDPFFTFASGSNTSLNLFDDYNYGQADFISYYMLGLTSSISQITLTKGGISPTYSTITINNSYNGSSLSAALSIFMTTQNDIPKIYTTGLGNNPLVLVYEGITSSTTQPSLSKSFDRITSTNSTPINRSLVNNVVNVGGTDFNISIKALVSAIDSTNAFGYGSELFAVFRKTGAVYTQVSTTDIIEKADSTNTTNIITDGTDVYIQYTGVIGKTFSWHTTYEINLNGF